MEREAFTLMVGEKFPTITHKVEELYAIVKEFRAHGILVRVDIELSPSNEWPKWMWHDLLAPEGTIVDGPPELSGWRDRKEVMMGKKEGEMKTKESGKPILPLFSPSSDFSSDSDGE